MPAYADLVHQTSSSTGTGAQTLATVSGKRTFLSAFGTGGTNTFDYFISHRSAAEWERGTGHESGGTLVRDTVLASSNANALVNFTAGAKDISNDQPAGLRVDKSYVDNADALKAPLASPAFTGTPTGITKTHVGLGNVDNTTDAGKPVSTAQQTALNLKADLASPAFSGTPTAPTSAIVANLNIVNTTYLETRVGQYVAGYLPLTGGALSGTLTVNGGGLAIVSAASNASLSLTKNVSNGACDIFGLYGSEGRWLMRLGDSTPESGANAGSNFSILRYDDNGTLISTAMSIDRANGGACFYNDMTIYRAGAPNTGLIFFGNTTTKYLYFDGNSYNFTGGNVLAGSGYKTCANGDINFGLQYNGGYNELSFNSGWKLAFDTNNGNFYYSGPYGSNYYTGGTSGDFVIRGPNAYKPGGGPWADSSDERIKNIVGEFTRSVDDIAALRPILYTFKGNDTLGPPSEKAIGMATPDEQKEAPKAGLTAPYRNSPHYQLAVDQKQFIGLVAQEVTATFPEMVTKRDGFINGQAVTDLHDLDTAPLVFALINAIKELKAQNESLAARIAILEGAA